MSDEQEQPRLHPLVEIAVAGDLAVVGWDRPTVQIISDRDRRELTVSESATEPLVLQIDGDARLNVPRDLAVRVARAAGDVRVRDLRSGLELDEVAGDLRVEDVRGPIHLAHISGDPRLQEIVGDIAVDSVEGDLHLHRIDGNVSGDRVSGDMRGEHITGDVRFTGSFGGDVSLANVDGDASIVSAGGDLKVSRCRSIDAAQLGGDLHVQDVAAEVSIQHVGGDATMANCRGEIKLDHIGGDLTARDVVGGLIAPNVGGRVRLRTAFGSGSVYDLSSHGNTTIDLDGEPTQLSATFELRSRGGGRVESVVPLTQEEPTLYRGQIGAGEATVRVTCDGNIRLGPAHRESKLDDVFDSVFDGLDQGLRSAFGPFAGGGGEFDRWQPSKAARQAQRAEERARRHVEAELERAQDAARRAAEKAQRQAERTVRQTTRLTWQWPHQAPGPAGEWPTRPLPPSPPPPPPRPRSTDGERLVILRMLADGTITTEDAARLLEALGG